MPQLVNIPTVQLTSTQAPKIAALNGFVFANQPAFEMCQDDKVIWYIYAYGGKSTHSIPHKTPLIKLRCLTRLPSPW